MCEYVCEDVSLYPLKRTQRDSVKCISLPLFHTWREEWKEKSIQWHINTKWHHCEGIFLYFNDWYICFNRTRTDREICTIDTGEHDNGFVPADVSHCEDNSTDHTTRLTPIYTWMHRFDAVMGHVTSHTHCLLLVMVHCTRYWFLSILDIVSQDLFM